MQPTTTQYNRTKIAVVWVTRFTGGITLTTIDSNQQAPYKTSGMEEVRSDWQGAESLHTEPERRRTDLGFGDNGIFFFFLKRWQLPTILAIAGFLLGLLLLAVTMFQSSVNTYKIAIQFTFPGIENGEYPDGTQFSVNDIIAARVLDEVYDVNDIQKYEISRSEFSESFQVVPLAENRQAIIAKYNALFNDRKSTLADVRENQRAMSDELEVEARRSATIIFTDTTLSIPSDAATKIVADVAAAWTDYAINVQGVVQQDITSPRPEEFNSDEIAELDRMAALRTVLDRASQLTGFIGDLSKQPNGQDVVDPETGKNTLSLRNDINAELMQIRALATEWVAKYAGEDGNTASSIQLFSQSIFLPDDAAATDYLIALDLLEDARSALVSNVDEISEQYDSIAIRDQTTGISVRDISRFTSRIRQFDLTQLRTTIINSASTRDADNLRAYYQTRLRDLRNDVAGLKTQIDVVNQSIAQQLEQTQGAGFSTSATNDASNPSLDSAFLDRLLALSGQTERDAFVRSLVRESIDLNTRKIDIEGQINRIEADLRLIERAVDENQTSVSNTSNNDAVEQSIRTIAEQLQTYASAVERISARIVLASEVFSIMEDPETPMFPLAYYLRDVPPADISLPAILENIKEIAVVTERIEGVINQASFGSEQQLYQPISSVEKSSFNPINTRSIAIIILLSILGLVIGLVVIGWRFITQVMERRRTA